MSKKVKVCITGAAGQIGYALLFRIASGQMFGPNTIVELNLLELETAMHMLEGVAMELDDCAFPLLSQVNIYSDAKLAMQDVNWALLIGAVPRKAGMERADLLKLNGKIFAEQGKIINAYATADVKTLVVGNPCNTNCLITLKHAPDRAPENFFAMTMLDELRARNQLANKAQVSVNDIRNMNIWGNHSSTQFPDFYHAQIKGQFVPDVIKDHAWLTDVFIPTVQQRGATVIKARGSSSAASAANAIIQTVYNLVHDTPAEESFSIGRYSRGEYGIDEGLIYSFPSKTVANQLTLVDGLEHNSFAQEKLLLTLDELRQEKAALVELGLLKD